MEGMGADGLLMEAHDFMTCVCMKYFWGSSE